MRRSLLTTIILHFIFHARKFYILTSSNPYFGRLLRISTESCIPFSMTYQISYVHGTTEWISDNYWPHRSTVDLNYFKKENMICINRPIIRHLLNALVAEICLLCLVCKSNVGLEWQLRAEREYFSLTHWFNSWTVPWECKLGYSLSEWHLCNW